MTTLLIIVLFQLKLSALMFCLEYARCKSKGVDVSFAAVWKGIKDVGYLRAARQMLFSPWIVIFCLMAAGAAVLHGDKSVASEILDVLP